MNFIPGSIYQGESDCSSLPASDWPFYRTTSLEQAAEESKISVYPTLIKDAERNISMDVISVKETKLDCSMISIDGKVIVQKSFDLSTGSQTISFDIPDLAPGSYIIDIRSSDGKINHRVRASKI